MSKSLIQLGGTYATIKSGEIKFPYINGEATREEIELYGTEELERLSEEYSIIESYPFRDERAGEKRMLRFKIRSKNIDYTSFWFRGLSYELGDNYIGSQEAGKALILVSEKLYKPIEGGVEEVLVPIEGVSLSFIEENGYVEYISGINTRQVLTHLPGDAELILVTQYADKKIDFEYNGTFDEAGFGEGKFFTVDISAGDQVEKIKDIQFIK